jgi:hypothetical protein
MSTPECSIIQGWEVTSHKLCAAAAICMPYECCSSRAMHLLEMACGTIAATLGKKKYTYGSCYSKGHALSAEALRLTDSLKAPQTLPTLPSHCESVSILSAGSSTCTGDVAVNDLQDLSTTAFCLNIDRGPARLSLQCDSVPILLAGSRTCTADNVLKRCQPLSLPSAKHQRKTCTSSTPGPIPNCIH